MADNTSCSQISLALRVWCAHLYEVGCDAWSMTRSLIGPLGSSSFKPELILNRIGAPVKYRLRKLSITSKHKARCMG
jgi:hypothetical protein